MLSRHSYPVSRALIPFPQNLNSKLELALILDILGRRVVSMNMDLHMLKILAVVLSFFFSKKKKFICA